MPANGDSSVVMKGITHGACDYLIKPVRMEELRNIWQHVVRKRGIESPKLGSCSNTQSTSSSELLENYSKKRKEVNFMGQGLLEDASILKRARVNWTVDLHQRFVTAVNQLGVENAVPKKLLDIMNVKGLTRENIASHLQKYRLFLKRLSGAKLERHPIASFQASDGGESGGSMHVLPDARRPNSVPSIKELNLGAGITESNVRAQNLAPGMVRSPTVFKALQQQQQSSANRAQVLGALGFVAAAPRKASFDLHPYLQLPQGHFLSSRSAPSSLGGFAHSGPQPLKLEDQMGCHLLSSRSMPSSLGGIAHSGPQPLKLDDEMGARPRGAQVEGFVRHWNINPVGKHDLGKYASADAQMQGSYANLKGNPANLTSGDERHACSEGIQAGRYVEIPENRNLSSEMSWYTPTMEMNTDTNLVQSPEEQLTVSDYLLDEEFL